MLKRFLIIISIWLIFIEPTIVVVLSNYFELISTQVANLLIVIPLLLLVIEIIILKNREIIITKTELTYIFIVFVYAAYGAVKEFGFIYVLKDILILILGPVAFNIGRTCSKLNYLSREEFKKLARRSGLGLFLIFITIPIAITHLLILIKKEINKENIIIVFALLIHTFLTASKSIFLAFILYIFIKNKWFKSYKLIILIFIILYVVFNFVIIYEFNNSFVRKSLAFYDSFSFIELINIVKNVDLNAVWVFDVSTAQRLYEFLLIINEMSLNKIIFGHGLGYSVDMSNSLDLSILERTTENSIDNVRTFHLMVTWLLAKTGLIGIILVTLYLKFVYNKIKHDELLIILFSFFVANILLTFGGFSLNYSTLFILGYLGKYKTRSMDKSMVR